MVFCLASGYLRIAAACGRDAHRCGHRVCVTYQPYVPTSILPPSIAECQELAYSNYYHTCHTGPGSDTTYLSTNSLTNTYHAGTNTKETYHKLHQPPFSPPAWLFGPAWTLLYGLMGYASHHATSLASQSLLPAVHEANRAAQTLYTTQLGLNFIWMPLFFGLGRPATALGDMVLLIGNVSLLMANWWDGDRTAFWLMAPYLGWLGYATYLNAGVGYLNGWTLYGKEREE